MSRISESVAAFQVITIGRFWVIPEDFRADKPNPYYAQHTVEKAEASLQGTAGQDLANEEAGPSR